MKCASRACVAAAVLATLSPLASASVHVVAPANPPSGTTIISTYHTSREGHKSYSLSRDGRYVAFTSEAWDLVPGVAPGFLKSAVFLRDRVAGTTVLVSHGSSPTDTGNNSSWLPRVSEGGEVVVFESNAFGYGSSSYVFDRVTNGVQPLPGLTDVGTTADGSKLVARSTTGAEANVVLIERATGVRRLISHRAGSPTETASPSWSPVVTPDGRFVAFLSTSPNLVAGLGESPGASQVFLYDTVTSTCLLVSRAVAGGYANANSGYTLRMNRDGRFIAYQSRATNLVHGQIDGEGTTDLFLFDRLTLETRLVTHTAASHVTSAEAGAIGSPGAFDISDDGSVIALETSASRLAPGVLDTNGAYDIYLYETATGLLQLASGQAAFPSLSSPRGGVQPSLSGDGRLVTFGTEQFLDPAQDDISVLDRGTNARRSVLATRVPGTVPNDYSFGPVLSKDGTFLIFRSVASNLAADVPDFDHVYPAFSGVGLTLYGAELPAYRLEAVSRSNGRAAIAYFPETGLLSLDGSTSIFDAYIGNVSSDRVEAGPGARPDALTTYVSDRRSGRVEALALRAPGVVSRSGLLQISPDGMTALLASGEDIIGTRPSNECTLTNQYSDTMRCTSLYLFDRRTGQISLITHTGDPSERASGYWATGPSMNDEGTFVVFRTRGGELGDRYGRLVLWERKTGALRPLPAGLADVLGGPFFLSRSGRRLIWAGYGGGSGLYLQDVQSGKLTLVDSGVTTVSPASVDWDGETVAYLTRPVSAYDQSLFVFSESTGHERIRTFGPVSGVPVLSADGRFLVFGEGPSRLVLWDRLISRRTEITAPDGLKPDPEQAFAVSADGSTVAFSTIRSSVASQVVHWDRLRGRPVLATAGKSETRGNGPSIVRGLDEHGDRLLIYSTASNLRPEDGPAVPPDALTGTLYVFDAPPVVTAVEPPCASATGGERIEVRGAHFQEGVTVRLAGVAATVVSRTSTSILVIAGPIPPGREPRGSVEVQNPDGASDSLAGAFSYPIRGVGCR